MKRILAGLVVIGVATVFAAGALDGTSWKIKVTPDKEAADKGESEFDDVLEFANEKMTATTCTNFGFQSSVYLVTENEEVIKWKTVQHSETNGLANWTGQIKGNEITGKLSWMRHDGTKVIYTFAGTRLEVPPKNDRTD